MHVSKHSMG